MLIKIYYFLPRRLYHTWTHHMNLTQVMLRRAMEGYET